MRKGKNVEMYSILYTHRRICLLWFFFSLLYSYPNIQLVSRHVRMLVNLFYYYTIMLICKNHVCARIKMYLCYLIFVMATLPMPFREIKKNVFFCSYEILLNGRFDTSNISLTCRMNASTYYTYNMICFIKDLLFWNLIY